MKVESLVKQLDYKWHADLAPDQMGWSKLPAGVRRFPHIRERVEINQGHLWLQECRVQAGSLTDLRYRYQLRDRAWDFTYTDLQKSRVPRSCFEWGMGIPQVDTLPVIGLDAGRLPVEGEALMDHLEWGRVEVVSVSGSGWNIQMFDLKGARVHYGELDTKQEVSLHIQWLLDMTLILLGPYGNSRDCNWQRDLEVMMQIRVRTKLAEALLPWAERISV